MRIFQTFGEMHSEVGRDLVELGTVTRSHSVQAQKVEGNPDYAMKELLGYAFKLSNVLMETSDLFSWDEGEWIDRELDDRLSERYINPGETWRLRPEVWRNLMREGVFDYTYNERIRSQLPRLLQELEKNPGTRQAVLTIYDRDDQRGMGGLLRIPCSLHYQFLIRGNYLHLIYSMRSCDYFTHFKFDMALACGLLLRVSPYSIQPGSLTVMIGSLHCFRKDWEAAGMF